MSDTTANNSDANKLGGGIPERAPPGSTVGAIGWLRENLFSSPLNSILTIASVALIVWTLPGMIEWVFLQSNFVAEDLNGDGTINRNDCIGEGACWMLIYIRWDQLFYGFYRSEGSLWRPTIAFFGLFLAVMPLLFEQLPHRKLGLLFALVYPFFAIWLLSGTGIGWTYELIYIGLVVAVLPLLFPKMAMAEPLSVFSKYFPIMAAALVLAGWFLPIGEASLVPGVLSDVSTHKWGGLMLTMVIGVVGIVLSLPIGVVLALGRRSQMPAVRLLCVIFIEFIRGVPLITLLFMASNMLPLFFPEGIDLDKLVRALIVVVAFSAAYMAEVVRGGLQAIPKGQYEAADAMGLSYWKSMYLIILPQALKIVIPGIVNSFIGLFKDTTLVLIIGLFDILGMAKAAVTHANWIGLAREAYIFVGVVYFVFCFSMSRYSIWLEGKLDTGHKR
jgi:general L-amino acid transport system permease protein